MHLVAPLPPLLLPLRLVLGLDLVYHLNGHHTDLYLPFPRVFSFLLLVPWLSFEKHMEKEEDFVDLVTPLASATAPPPASAAPDVSNQIESFYNHKRLHDLADLCDMADHAVDISEIRANLRKELQLAKADHALLATPLKHFDKPCESMVSWSERDTMSYLCCGERESRIPCVMRSAIVEKTGVGIIGEVEYSAYIRDETFMESQGGSSSHSVSFRLVLGLASSGIARHNPSGSILISYVSVTIHKYHNTHLFTAIQITTQKAPTNRPQQSTTHDQKATHWGSGAALRQSSNTSSHSPECDGYH